MVAYAGTLGLGPAVDMATLASLTPALGATARVTYPYPPRAGALASAGPRSVRQPVVERTDPFAGARAYSINDDWYHRIHVLPGRLDLGNLLSSQNRDVEVWNAHLAPRTLNAITATGTGGLGLAAPGGVVPPTAFGALESRIYQLSVSLDGPPVLDASYGFDFGAEAPRLTVTGRRVLVWGFPPDWSAAVVEGAAWATDVLTAHDGSEQRLRLRVSPRRSWEYSLGAVGDDAPRLTHLTHGWGGRVYALPVWTDPHALPAPLAAGSTAIALDTNGRDYRAGGLLVLHADARTAEAAEILAVNATSITLKKGTEQAWPAATRVYPVRLARLTAPAGLEFFDAQVWTARLRFTGEDLDLPVAADPGPLYRGVPVDETPPSRAGAGGTEFARALEVLTPPAGPRAVADRMPRPVAIRRHGRVLSSRAEITAFRAWFHARAGRLAAFWAPSWRADFRPTRTISATATVLTVANTGYARLIAAAPEARDLRLATRSGQIYYRRITGATEVDATEETLSLDTALGVSLAPADWLLVSHLAYARLEDDAMQLTWFTDTAAEVELGLRALPAP